MKKIVLVSIFLANSLFGACTINNYNSAATCAQVQTALEMAVKQTEQYFKTTRKQT